MERWLICAYHVAVLVENGQLDAWDFDWKQDTGGDASNTSSYHSYLLMSGTSNFSLKCVVLTLSDLISSIGFSCMTKSVE